MNEARSSQTPPHKTTDSRFPFTGLVGYDMNRNRVIRIKHPCNEGLCLQGAGEMTRRGGGREEDAPVGAGADPAGAPCRAGYHVPILHLCPE